MYRQLFATAALAATTFAQNATNSTTGSTGSSGSLTDLLGATSSLSTLTSAVMGVPGLASMLGSLSNVTILAPSNEAFEKFMETPAAAALTSGDNAAISALLSYHILNGTFPASAVTDTPAFVPTMLNNTAYTNVTGGQVVECVRQGDNVLFYSGLLMNASVTTADQNFTGGVVHIIDTVLTIPETVSNTAINAGLSGVAGALTRARLVDAVDSLSDVTIFAPNNSAFQAIGSALPNLTTSQLASILQYHVINGTVAYSSSLTDGMTVPALAGGDLRITVSDAGVFVNSAKVLIPDVLVANGVVHVIDNVLNPNNTSAEPEPTASTQLPAFSGASTVANLGGITSGIPTPSATVGTAPTPAAGGAEDTPAAGEATSTPAAGAASPMRTGAIGAAALFAGAGAWINV
ncbi:MAG: hypothetical protein Q9207_006270 [Kuettlingeria erythrocarpa]